jgi:ATP-dependent DNA helicase RecG
VIRLALKLKDEDMKTQKELLQILNSLRLSDVENEVVEFKEANNSYDFGKIGKYFSALCNEANLKSKESGWLIFGIKDKGKTIVGSNYRSNKADLEKLKYEIANKTTNRISFKEIYEIRLEEGRVIMFEIPAAPLGVPVSWEGHYYGRDGESLGPLNLEEMERIRRQVAHVDWSAVTIDGAIIDDLDPVALALARRNFVVKNPRLAKDEKTWSNEVFLKKAKISIGGKLTRTAILLLGLPESDHFISPAVAQITWQLRDANNVSKDYEHFGCPFLLAIDKVYGKIRNLKYRYSKIGTLFPEEVDQFDQTSIREALNNCIAHQDYTKGERINITEFEDGRLIFSNAGEFLPGSVESVLESDEPPRFYRNANLAHAMVNFNMIDTVGSGIKNIYLQQKHRFFPMPDYDLSGNMVRATLIGKILDIEYAKVLARNPLLSLEDIILLDKVQKSKPLTDEEAHHLRSKHLIEGKKPKYIISENLAKSTGQVAEYLRQKGENTDYCKEKVLDLIVMNKTGTSKKEIKHLLANKLSESLNEKQKSNRMSYILRKLKAEGKIKNAGSDAIPKWVPK